MKSYVFIFSLIVNFLLPSTASATSTLPITLEQLSTRASLIFYGKVVSNQVRKDELSGRIATFTEFEIIDLIKGEAGTKHTIKQIGGYLKESKTALRIHGIPKFQTGNNYVVFLPKKSKLGFSSPLGLHQGSFSVLTIKGEQLVSNGQNLTEQPLADPADKNSRSIQVPLAVRADNPSQARLDDFINTVRSYNTQ